MENILAVEMPPEPCSKRELLFLFSLVLSQLNWPNLTQLLDNIAIYIECSNIEIPDCSFTNLPNLIDHYY